MKRSDYYMGKAISGTYYDGYLSALDDIVSDIIKAFGDPESQDAEYWRGMYSVRVQVEERRELAWEQAKKEALGAIKGD